MELIEIMNNKEGYEVGVYDPHVEFNHNEENNLNSACRDSDLIVLAVNHDAFKELPLKDIYNITKSKNIFDTRNFLDREDVEEAGFKYFLIGEGVNKLIK